jgi:2-oxo-4-hydroxy-4-carboxy-5-ureidoimidazoline decarboxylase
VSYSIEEINHLRHDEFLKIVGPVFEHSPWIAERGWAARPFENKKHLHTTLRHIVENASAKEQMSLIRAHPDLVGRVVLTAESQGEQTAAGLMNLTPEDVAAFDKYNHEYKARFDFPFVICARKNKKEAILAAFPKRLQNTMELEQKIALQEIYEIALIRIDDLISP